MRSARAQKEEDRAMKPIELQLPISQDGTVTLPPEVFAQIGYEETVRLIVMVPEQLSEEEEEAAWIRMGMEHFFKEDDPGDALYNDVPTR
jgi:hypothetical protein